MYFHVLLKIDEKRYWETPTIKIDDVLIWPIETQEKFYLPINFLLSML